MVALGLELERPPPHHVQRAHVILGPIRPAALHEGALVRREAMVADGHVGEGAGNGGELRGDLPLHPGEEPLHQRCDVSPHEQVREIGVAALAVQVHHLGPLDRDPVAAREVRLHPDVRDVLRLHVGR